jgi:pilus assembly protein CpaC
MDAQRPPRRITHSLLGAACLASLDLVLAAPALAQTPQDPLAGRAGEPAALTDSASPGAPRQLTLNVNKSYMLEFDADIDDIIVANPAIANVTARDRRRIAVMGVAPGQSNIVFLDKSGRKLMVLDVSVTDGVAGLDQLRDMIRRYAPEANVQVESVNGRIILAGVVPNMAANDRVVTLARQYVPKEDAVINMLTVSGKDQVALKVRIVEMQRFVVKQLGINLSGAIGFGELDGSTFQNVVEVATNNTFGIAGSALGGIAADITNVNLFNGRLQSSVGVGLNALERVGALRTLAEPNLTAISGESAKFLAGGEYPVPVAQDEGSIGIEFKPYGVGLGFTPVVLSEGRISLQVSTEVSELTSQGAFQSRAVSGFDPITGEPTLSQTITIPALKVRRAETTVELPSGGSLVIAGLIQEQTKQQIDSVPGAKDLPILGSLFRSRDFQNDETELVVIVTPYLVDPTDPQKLRTPDKGYVVAGDARSAFFGKLNEVYAVPGASVDPKAAPKGSAGFIFD